MSSNAAAGAGPSRRIGSYEIRETLGSGMSAKVKRGVDVSTGESVALKLIDSSKMTDRQYNQLQREIDAMKTLNHPNILNLKFVDDRAVYPKSDGSSMNVILLVLELASGGELFDFMMHTGAFAENYARTYFFQLVSALKACHDNHIYHRDIKPENLLLDAQFQLKVADFGLSSVQDQDGVTLHTECGTRSYMAPEVLTGQGYNGAMADIWSSGVVLFIMLAGNPPFQIANKRDWWFNAVSLGRYDRFWAAHLRGCPHFPPQAQALLNRIFVADPAERYTLDDIMQDPWMQGTRFSISELHDEMSQRQARVDAKKQAEREEATRQKQSRRRHDVFDANTNRSSMGQCLGVPMLPTEFNPGRTTFYTLEHPVRVLELLQAILQATDSLALVQRQETEGQRRFTLSARLQLPGENICIGDEVVQTENETIALEACVYQTEQDTFLVDMQRHQGDIFAFEKLFRDIVSRMESESAAVQAPAVVEEGADEELLSDDIGMI